MKHSINSSHCVREFFIMSEVNNENSEVSSFGGKKNIHTEKRTHNKYTTQWIVTKRAHDVTTTHIKIEITNIPTNNLVCGPFQLITPHPPPPVTILLIYDIIVYVRLFLESYKIVIKLLLLLLMFLRFIPMVGFCCTLLTSIYGIFHC